MKKIIFIVVQIFICSITFAQSPPEAINYQAVARNLSGVPLVNQTIAVEYSILQGSPSGAVVYSETHAETTNQFGLFTSEVGIGTVISGNFSAINWGSSTFYLQVKVNGDVMPATQLLSVPYALHAKTASSGVPGADGYNSLLDTLSAGAVCPNGGYQVLMGLDTDASGILDAGEVTKTFIVCNGADGATGPAGASGTTYFAGNGISLSNDTITNLGDADNDSSNELITLTNLNGNIIEITESGTLHSIDLTSVLGASYTQGAGISIVGNTISATDTSMTNELQILSLNTAQDSLFISDGNGIQLPTAAADDWGNDTVNVAGGNIIGSGTVSNPLIVIDNDTSATNEYQDLSVNATNGNEINISNGTGFFLSQIPPTATNQVLTWNGSNWVAQNPGTGADNWGTQKVKVDSLTIFGDGTAAQPLSGFDGDYNSLSNQPTIPTNTSDLTNDSGFITSEVDGDITNELQTLSASGGTSPQIDLSNGGGNVTIQGAGGTTVSQAGNAITINSTTGTTYTAGAGIDITTGTISNTSPDQVVNITGGGATSIAGTYPNFTISSIDNVNDADFDPNNEIQTLSFADPNLTLSNGGGTIDLSSLSSTTYWSPNATDIFSNNTGNVGIGTNSPQSKLDVVGTTNILSNTDPLIVRSSVDGFAFRVKESDNGFDAVSIYGYGTRGRMTMNSNGTTTINLDADPSISSFINAGNFGIGTNSPQSKFHVATNDVIMSSFMGSNNFGSVIMVGNSTPNMSGMLMKSSSDTAFIGFSAINQQLTIETLNSTTGRIRIATPDLINLRADTIYTEGGGGSPTYNFNNGTFLTDSLYVYGAGANTSGNVLTSNGNGKAEWKPLPAAAAPAWSLTGNAGTIAGTNFIGTTDAQDLDIRTNNTVRARITQKGQLEILNTGTSVFIGEGAGDNDDLNNRQNTFVGHQAGETNTTGNWNTALGYGALDDNVTGTSNTAIGRVALGYSTGSNNTATGTYALFWGTTGSGNTATGTYAGQTITTGSNNTFLGYNADATVNNITNATAIGYNTKVSQSNSLILGNNANVGIGTDAPLEALHLKGIDMDIDVESNTSTGNSSSLHIKRSGGTPSAPTIMPTGQHFGNISYLGYDGSDYESSVVIEGSLDGNPATDNMPGKIVFHTRPTGVGASVIERMRINASGNVGIGASVPDGKLHVAETKAVYDGTDGAYVFIQNTDATANSGQLAGIKFRTDGVGAGTNARYKGGIAFEKTGSWGVGDLLFLTNSLSSNASVTAADERMRITSSGNVGIGTASPTALLSVNGVANKTGGGTWAVYSDARSKENVNDYNKGLTELLQLRPVSFNYKSEFKWGDKTYVGLIAQEVELVVPTMVEQKEVNGISDFREVDPNEINYMLINAIKEQQQMIEELRKEVELLKNK